MKTYAPLLLFTIAAANTIPFDPELDELWQNFKKAFGKNYDGREEVARRLIWEQHVVDIVKHNLEADVGLHKYRKGLNEYSDMGHAEFVKHFNGFKRTNFRHKNGSTWLNPLEVRLPDNVDWRKEGLVTDIKNQGSCGSCWAFSSTGSLEGQNMKKTGKLVSLSEQNLVDCSGSQGNNGCDGGEMDYAFEYIKENDGIDTEDSYPYTGVDGDSCLFNGANVGATVSGYVDIPSGDEDALMQAVATVGPVSVAIDASQISFQLYQSGIYDEPDCSSSAENLDHAVLAIGYGSKNGVDYWLVKNSWGTTWGMDGYIKMSRNRDNQCGIATMASYPLV